MPRLGPEPRFQMARLCFQSTAFSFPSGLSLISQATAISSSRTPIWFPGQIGSTHTRVQHTHTHTHTHTYACIRLSGEVRFFSAFSCLLHVSLFVFVFSLAPVARPSMLCDVMACLPVALRSCVYPVGLILFFSLLFLPPLPLHHPSTCPSAEGLTSRVGRRLLCSVAGSLGRAGRLRPAVRPQNGGGAVVSSPALRRGKDEERQVVIASGVCARACVRPPKHQQSENELGQRRRGFSSDFGVPR